MFRQGELRHLSRTFRARSHARKKSAALARAARRGALYRAAQ
jgi:hypothetical protein